MTRIFIEGIGLCGPGLDGWPASLPILAGTQAYAAAPTRIPLSDLLPANERRRAVATVKLALAAGAEAFAAAGRDAAQTASLFASSGGDGATIDDILKVLASPNREISPTKFHNSVHNAPSGYWGIATASRAASSSLCGYDGSFAAGLLEAAAQAVCENLAVALIAYDVCYPPPLSLARPIGAAFAVALILVPAETAKSIASLEIHLGPNAPICEVTPPALEMLRQTTPAARCLPLLAAIARNTATELQIDYFDDLSLLLKYTPMTDSLA